MQLPRLWWRVHCRRVPSPSWSTLNIRRKSDRKHVAYADEVGVPDDDDPIGIVRWQECLQATIKYLPKTARNALLRDVTGFYVRTFLLALNKAANQPSDSVAGLMSKEIHRLSGNGSRNRGLRSKTQHRSLTVARRQYRHRTPPGGGTRMVHNCR